MLRELFISLNEADCTYSLLAVGMEQIMDISVSYLSFLRKRKYLALICIIQNYVTMYLNQLYEAWNWYR